MKRFIRNWGLGCLAMLATITIMFFIAAVLQACVQMGWCA